MKFMITLSMGGVLLLFTACDGETTPKPPLSTQEIRSLPTTIENEYLAAINKVRTENQVCGNRGYFSAATPLTWNNKLYAAAYEHSNDLAITNTFSHEGSGEASDLTGVREGGRSQGIERMEAYGYTWSRYGENIAAGTNTDTVAKAISQWMESDGHCANIMNPDFTEVGMAMVKNSKSRFTHYWTQDFGTPLE